VDSRRRADEDDRVTVAVDLVDVLAAALEDEAPAA
jgi:hypothetical protein